MVLVDAIARRLPGALAAGSGENETFSAALGGGIEYPHYTRPAAFRGWQVPDVLLSGNHAQIDGWRASRAAPGVSRERRRRPPRGRGAFAAGTGSGFRRLGAVPLEPRQ